jgi:purine-nucleoside phosphorylase
VSDHLLRHEEVSPTERETGFMAMAEIALDTVIEAPADERTEPATG